MVTSLNIEAFVEDKNPYVGPQPMRSGDAIFGRNREISALRHFISAERIVLLHSPSGAGKSSLVAAGLIPVLADRFEIWGPTRVNQMPPGPVANRFTWSAISGFEQSLRRDSSAGITAAHLVQIPETLAGLTLTEYVAQRERTKSPLLIFDQFEEILRVDSIDTATKQAFFTQLGDLLSDSRIWALFIMREDYLAPLDPYLRLVPTHFQNRYRIDRLKTDMATEAIVRPTENLKRKYDPEAVELLVNNLATVNAQQLDGTFADQVGDYVEPLQLQVVCYDIWSRKAPGDLLIGADDVGKNITSALMNYYDHSVRLAAGENDLRERQIREWFQEMLITPDGVRSQVRQEREQSGGLDNNLVGQLLDTYLVRAEPRGFTNWYELAHDRLIAPVRESNRKWLDERLSKLQKVATLWDKEKRSPGLLLRGKELREVERWAKENSSSVHKAEQDFLSASAVKRRSIWAGHGVRTLIVVLAIGMWFSRQAALEEKRKADVVFGKLFKRKAREFLDEARDRNAPGSFANSWIYTVASLSVSPVPVAESAGHFFLHDTMPGQPEPPEECVKEPTDTACTEMQQATFLASGAKIAYLDAAGKQVECYRCDFKAPLNLTNVTSFAATDRRRYAVGLKSGQLQILDGQSANVGAPITALSYGEGPWLAAGTATGELIILGDRDLGRSASNSACLDCGAVEAIGWKNDSTLAAGFGNSRIRLFNRDLTPIGNDIVLPVSLRSNFSALAFWPDTNLIATGHTDGSIHVWDSSNGLELAYAKAHDAPVLSITFNPRADQMASVSADGDIHRTPLTVNMFGRTWVLKNLLLADEGFKLRRELDETSRRMLGYRNSREEPEPGPEAEAKALEYFPPRKIIHRD